MENSSNRISFHYEFISGKGAISNKDRRDVSVILTVEALFTIKINDAIYFEAELAILEFYKALFKWKETLTKENIKEFHYYTIEYDEYEDGALISLIPFSNKARIKSIWAQWEVSNVFDLDKAVQEFIALEGRLRKDIEQFYQIDLKGFIKHIPLPCIK